MTFSFIFFFLSSLHLLAGTRTFTGTGNFSNTTRWDNFPSSGDNLIINGTCTVDNNAGTDNVAYGSLTIGSSLPASISWAVGGTNRLNVTNISSSFAGSTLNMTNGGTLVVRGTITTTNLTYTPGTGTIEVRSNIPLPAAYTTYYNLVINGTALTTVLISVNTTVNGNLTITGGIFNSGAFSMTIIGTTTVTGTLSVTSIIGTKTFGSLIINGTFNNTLANAPITIAKNLTNNGTLNLGTGRVTFTGAASNTISGTAATTAFGGGITVNKGTSTANILDVQCVITMPSGGLILTNGTFKLSSASTIAPFSNTAAATLPATVGLWNNGGTINSPASMDWTINGYLRCSGGTVNIGMIADDLLLPQSGSAITIDGGTVNVVGCMLIFAPAVFTMSAGIMNLGTVGSTVVTSLPPFSIGDTLATFNMSGGTIVIVHPCDPGGLNYGFYDLAKTYTVTGGTLQIGNGSTYAGEIIRINSTVPLYDVLVNSANVTARLSPLLTTTTVVKHNVTVSLGTFDPNNRHLKIGNDWVNNGIFLPNDTIALVTFDASFDLIGSIGGTSVTTFRYLNINTVSALGIVQLTNNTIVNSPAGYSSVLTLTSGALDLNGKSLSIISGLNTAVVRTAGYILSEKSNNSSKMIWSIDNNTTSHTFPFGTASGSYIPFILNLTAGNIGNVTLSTYPTGSNNVPYPTTPILVTNLYGSTGADNSANVVDRFWQIDKDGPSGTATITFTATAAEVGAILLPTAQRYNFTTNKWQTPLPGQTSTATSATVPGVTTFSPWTLSSQSAILPIQLVSFDAAYTNPGVSLNWITASEINSDYFVIEKTTDEKTFETVCQVEAAGHSMQTLNYQTTDMHPSTGVSYYRLKQVDLDGTASYSDLEAIEIQTASDQISISPNPVTHGKITVKVQNHLAETLDISVTDLNGQILFTTKNKLNEGQQSSFVIDNLGNLPKGLYILRISGASEIFNKKITVY